MSKILKHLIFSNFEGTGTLTLQSPEHEITLPGLPVQFDPQTLEFVIFLPASHELVGHLASCHLDSPQLLLCNLSLRSPQTGVQLEAEKFSLHRLNPLSDWPEGIGLLPSDYENGEDGAERRLVLGPSVQQLEFHSVNSVSEQYPYQVCYADACEGLVVPSPLAHVSLAKPVEFSVNCPKPGFVFASSEGDFSELEKRIHAALMLAHGRDLPWVARLEDHQISFYGSPKNTSLNCLPLLKKGRNSSAEALLDALLKGFVCLSAADFKHAFFALRFFLLGKTADVPVEVRFLQLMTCVEAMDGAETRQLKEECTAALLGVSGDAAALFNGMRNSLVHGRGGYREAFEAVLAENFGERPLQLELELKPCLSADRELDFCCLWLRLCERLDAFWCAYLDVAPELVKERSSLRSVPLMPAICLDALHTAIENLQKNKGAAVQTESQEVLDLRNANKRLESEKRDLAEQLAKQGKYLAELKNQLAAASGA